MPYPILASTATYDVEERLESRSNGFTGNGSNITVVYRYIRKDGGVIDPDDVASDVQSQTNFDQPHPVFSAIRLAAFNTDLVGDAFTACDVNLNFESPADSEDDEGEVWEYDLNAQTATVKSVAGADQLTWDVKNQAGAASVTDGLGLDAKGNAQGIQAYRPTGALRVSKKYDFADFTVTERSIVFNLQAKTNDDTWKGFGKGEVLFLGARISYNYDTEIVTVNYSFLFGPAGAALSREVYKSPEFGANRTFTATVDDADAEVKPFDYVWEEYGVKDVYKSATKEDGKEKLNLLLSVHLAKVYDEGDFDTLGLTGGPA